MKLYFKTREKCRIRQIGFSAHVRNMRNLGISFNDAYVMLFGKEPTK